MLPALVSKLDILPIPRDEKFFITDSVVVYGRRDEKGALAPFIEHTKGSVPGAVDQPSSSGGNDLLDVIY